MTQLHLCVSCPAVVGANIAGVTTKLVFLHVLAGMRVFYFYFITAVGMLASSFVFPLIRNSS